jgi:drug/metabolite transporter (DMT)-like permease
MSERYGVGMAVLSSAVGGGAAVATRYLVEAADPITLAALRFGGGFLCLLPLALAMRTRWPGRADWPAVAGLGLLFYGIFFVLYNLALGYTTVARGTLALSMVPLMTMLAGAALGVEKLSLRKTAGVMLAVGGVAASLAAALTDAPEGAWRGDLTMAAATLCMALYSVWSRPFIRRSSALGFVAASMGAGAALLVAISVATGNALSIAAFGPRQYLAVGYMAAIGSALSLFLWVYALRFASPTQVANTLTVNPMTAALGAAAILGEPIAPALVPGLISVGAGIWIATGLRRSVR